MDTTVNTAILGRDDQAGGMGRTLTRLAVAGLMAVLLLGLMSNIVDARAVTTTLGQNDFVNACRNGGGTSKRVGSRVVQCTTADGTVVTCDFNTSPASCTIPFKPAPVNPLSQPATGGVLDVYEPVDSGPKVRGVAVARTDAVLVQAEPTPSAQPEIVAQTDAGLVQAEPTPSADEGVQTIAPVESVERAVIVEVEDETP